MHYIDIEQRFLVYTLLHIPSEEDLGNIGYRMYIIGYSNSQTKLCPARLRTGSKWTTITILLLLKVRNTSVPNLKTIGI